MVESDVRLVGRLLEHDAPRQVCHADVELQHGLAGGLEISPAHRQRVLVDADMDALGRLGNR